jgi:signal transduction histidine kinase/CheY-like chemotaxis protein
MSEAQIATLLGIVLLVAMSTHVFYRRPPAALWPALPMVFFSALIFSFGDLFASIWSEDLEMRWAGMLMVYTGLLMIAPGWWLFTTRFSEMVGHQKIPFRSAFPVLVTINVFLWITLITNPWHGQFIETRPLGRSEYGPLWYVTAVVNYAALCATVFVHAREGYFAQNPTIRAQCWILVVAVSIPMSMSMYYVFSSVALSFDPTALGYAFSCLLFLFAVERRDLFVLESVSLPGVLDHDADPIVIVTRHHQLIYANPNAQDLFGRGTLNPGAPIDEILALAVPSFSLAGSNKNAPHSQEHRFTSPSGIESFVLIEVSIVERSHGNEIGMCLRLRDRTALRNALNESEEHFALLESLDLAMGEGLLFKEQSGEIRYINEAFAHLWGIPVRKMFDLGHQLQAYLGTKLSGPPPETMQWMWNAEGESFKSIRRESCDLTMRDGRILEVRTLPIETTRGFQGRAWRMSDVTQARQESQAMIQAQKLEGLGLLAGGIAHDFNNLLMTVLGNTEIARKGAQSAAPIEEALSGIEAAATTAAQLTGQLLAYAGKTTFMTESLDLSLLIREVANLVAVTIPKNIEIHFRLEDDLPLIRGGSAQIRQVLMNLISNAADAIDANDTAKGTIEIVTGIGRPAPMSDGHASIEHGKISADVVYVSICDNGAGMDAATLTKIFDPFFTTKFAGHGLGLAATRGILDSHEGQLRIETKQGLGSTFTFMLPGQERSRPDLKKSDFSASPTTFANRDVLVVDDEASIRAILTQHLTAVGFNVHLASNGKQALAVVEEIGPELHLVIMDITMPGLSGVETWTQLRKIHSELPIIMSSGHPQETLQDLEGWNTAYDGFIQKPYRSQALFLAVASLLDPGGS